MNKIEFVGRLQRFKKGAETYDSCYIMPLDDAGKEFVTRGTHPQSTKRVNFSKIMRKFKSGTQLRIIFAEEKEARE